MNWKKLIKLPKTQEETSTNTQRFNFQETWELINISNSNYNEDTCIVQDEHAETKMSLTIATNQTR